MSRYDRESIDAVIARAKYERNMALAEILADGILYVARGLNKAWHGLIGLFSRRPVASA